jgi:hypothetical protein
VLPATVLLALLLALAASLLFRQALRRYEGVRQYGELRRCPQRLTATAGTL